MDKTTTRKQRQSGAVSLFAVIFSTLLISIIVISFTQLMIRDQQQATNNDLSQSAYDSALAGVEDAKRVIRACQQGNSAACAALADEERQNDCKVVARAGVNGAVNAAETAIQSSSGENSFDQAYTCVNIASDTEDYVFDGSDGRSQLIPLKATGAFNRITVEWFMQDDISSNSPITSPPGSSDELPARSEWGAATPPLMRAQVITPGADFTIDDLNGNDASQTAFLRPGEALTSSPGPGIRVVLEGRRRAEENRLNATATLDPVSCTSNYGYQGYACRSVLEIKSVSTAASKNAILRLTPIYNDATVRVKLSRGNTPVLFDGVQPLVDSTGRANDLFRRVAARVSIGDNNFPYPDNALDSTNGLCKSFQVSGDRVLSQLCN